MAILLFPTVRDLSTDVVKGPVVLVEQFIRSDGSREFYSSIYANHITVDRKVHTSLADAIVAASERNRDSVRINRPASFLPADPTRTDLDMGHVAPPAEAEDGKQPG